MSSALEKTRAQGHWRWVHLRECADGHTVRILGGDTRRRPDLPPGAILCPVCGERVTMAKAKTNHH